MCYIILFKYGIIPYSTHQRCDQPLHYHTPVGGDQYKGLHIGVINSPDIFQDKINDLFQEFDFIRTYIYNSLTLPKVDWEDSFKKIGT